MDDEVRKRLEYEEQFFGVSSQFFADSFKNLIQEELDSKITMMVEDYRGKLIRQAKNPETFELAVKKMKDDLTTLYRNSLEEASPEIESKISNFINIPPNVLLSEDLPVKAGIDGNLIQIKEENENLKGTFLSLLYVKQKILEELEEADSTIFLMEQAIRNGKFDFNALKEICASSNISMNLSNKS